MKVTRFDRDRDLIVVSAWLWGPRQGPHRLDVAVDTGSSETLLTPEATDLVGYSARQGDQLTVILPDGFGIDGLLGLSFLRNLNYEIRSGEGRILADRIG